MIAATGNSHPCLIAYSTQYLHILHPSYSKWVRELIPWSCQRLSVSVVCTGFNGGAVDLGKVKDTA